MSPTHYHLLFKLNEHDDYDVYETHCGQEPGSLMSNREFVDVILRKDMDKFISDFADKCESYGDKLVSCEVVL